MEPMAGRHLTPDQVASFHTDGYLPIGKLLDDELVGILRAEYDRLFAEARQTGHYRNLAIDNTESVQEKAEAEGQMLQITQMCERSVLYRRLLYDDRILDLIQDLIGPNIQLFHDQALYKPAHQGDVVFWHQDNAYWRCVPANLVSCWLTLDDVNRENGAMHVIPGSHLNPIEHHQSDSSNALLDSSDRVNADGAVVVDLPAGGVMLHHCQTLHYTPPNRTDRQRRAFAIHFMTPGTIGKEGRHLEVSFARPLLRARM